MFERIGIGRDHCHFCGEYRPVAELYSLVDPPENNVAACEGCIRATAKAAELLKTLREAKAPTPKKPRKGAQSRASGPPLHPPKEAVSSLLPAGSS